MYDLISCILKVYSVSRVLFAVTAKSQKAASIAPCLITAASACMLLHCAGHNAVADQQPVHASKHQCLICSNLLAMCAVPNSPVK